MKSTKKITSIVLALMMLVISVAGLVTVNASTGGTLQPTTAQPTTVQPTTVQPTTAQPEPTTASSEVVVNATSNLFPAKTAGFTTSSLKGATIISGDLACGDVNGDGQIGIDDVILNCRERS